MLHTFISGPTVQSYGHSVNSALVYLTYQLHVYAQFAITVFHFIIWFQTAGLYLESTSHRDMPPLLLFRTCTTTHGWDPNAPHCYQLSRYHLSDIKFFFTIANMM